LPLGHRQLEKWTDQSLLTRPGKAQAAPGKIGRAKYRGNLAAMKIRGKLQPSLEQVWVLYDDALARLSILDPCKQ
jgi:hypothetical protein